MEKLIIQGQPLPNMPWEERPEGERNVMWRCSKNPIIPRDLLPMSNSIFNSAVVPFGNGFAGVFMVPTGTSMKSPYISNAMMRRLASGSTATTRACAALATNIM